MCESAKIEPRALLRKKAIPNAVRKQHLKGKILQTQAVVLVLCYIVFCITINDLKTSDVHWIGLHDKLFFGFLLLLGFGASEGVSCLLDFLETFIPKLVSKSANKHIKDMILNQNGMVKVKVFLLLVIMAVIFTLYGGVILVRILVKVEIWQQFFKSVSEDFLRRYCMVFVVSFYMCSMVIGKLIYYLKDAVYGYMQRETTPD